MKRSTKILVSILAAILAEMFLSNMVMKAEFNSVDKTDLYWNYEQVLNQHFKYLKIDGGNITNFAFEQSPHCSVRVLNEWLNSHSTPIRTYVEDDTLFVKFIYKPADRASTGWMQWTTLVRISAPELLSVEGMDTKLEMLKLKQKGLTVKMCGRSTFEVESLMRHLDSLNISQKDSSSVVIELSTDYWKSNEKHILNSDGMEFRSPQTMDIQSVKADVQGYSLLDLGHAQINSLKLKIEDSAAVILSGGALRKLK